MAIDSAVFIEIELDDEILAQLERIAADEGTTIEQLISDIVERHCNEEVDCANI